MRLVTLAPETRRIYRGRVYQPDVSDHEPSTGGWFEGLGPGDVAGTRDAVADGSAEEPRDWPTLAVDAGFAASADEYYDRLHDATTNAARTAVRERERADDRQLVHTVRAMDDCERTANELAERVAEWGGSRHDDAGTGVGYARSLVASREQEADDPELADPTEARLHGLARRCVALDDEAAALRTEVERAAPEVAPNLSALAGPVLAARLIALGGGLADLATSPSSTVQVLGAEDALFAHLRGDAPSPKHGIIFTHEYVRGTAREHRGSAARALAGKLTIAARVDHYSGTRRPELAAELEARIARIRGRGGGDE